MDEVDITALDQNMKTRLENGDKVFYLNKLYAAPSL
jgi:hypothetical protein